MSKRYIYTSLNKTYIEANINALIFGGKTNVLEIRPTKINNVEERIQHKCFDGKKGDG